MATTILVRAQEEIPTGQLGNAIQNLNNPQGAAYRAVVADNAMNITGSVTAVSAGDRGVQFAVEFENLPTEGGPFRESNAGNISSIAYKGVQLIIST
jgi:hypothetical protein